MNAPHILTYVDACLLIAAFRVEDARNRQAREIIDDMRRKFLYSDALWLELMPKPLYFKRQSEVAFYRDFFARAHHLPMTAAVMARARDIAARYGLAAMDAIHIAHAIEAGADELISAEKPSRPMFDVQEAAVLTIATD